jgi:hypothetical protein
MLLAFACCFDTKALIAGGAIPWLDMNAAKMRPV